MITTETSNSTSMQSKEFEDKLNRWAIKYWLGDLTSDISNGELQKILDENQNLFLNQEMREPSYDPTLKGRPHDTDKLDWGVEKIEANWDEINWETFCPTEVLTADLLERYENFWNWDLIAEQAPADSGIIEKFANKIYYTLLIKRWDIISKAPDYYFALFEKYCISHVLWHLLVRPNNGWAWCWVSWWCAIPMEDIEKYEDKWDWEKLSANIRIPWTVEMVEKYADRLNWEQFSDHCNPAFINLNTLANTRFHWQWDKLSTRHCIRMQWQIVDKYAEKINWTALIAESGYGNPIGFYRRYKKYIPTVDFESSYLWCCMTRQRAGEIKKALGR